MEDLLARHSSLVRQLRKERTIVTVESITKIFDDIVTFLNNTDRDSSGLYVLATISHELASINTLKLFDNPNIIDHELFKFLQSTFEMLLTKSNYLQYVKMTSEEEQCFYEISYLISHLCLYRNETLISLFTQSTTKHSRKLEPIHGHSGADKIPLINHFPHVKLRKTKIIADKLLVDNEITEKSVTDDQQMLVSSTNTSHSLSYQDIFLTKKVLLKLSRTISDLSQNDYTPYHVTYKVTDRLVRLCSKLTEINVDSLIDSIVQCLDSNFYLTIFDTIDLRQPLFDPKQSFFIRECFDFIDQHGYKRQEKIAKKLCQRMFNNTTTIFDKHLPVILESGDICELDDRKSVEKGARMQALSHHIKLLNYFALTPSTRKEFKSGTIIDYILSILSNESLVKSAHRNHQLFHVDVGIVAWSLTLLYNLIFDKELFVLIKERNSIDICDPFHTAMDDTIHFASQTLSSLLKQKEIDIIQDPYRLTKAYLYYIKKTIDQPNQTFLGIRLEGTLENLEKISQNEEIKEAIVKDEQGLEWLAECVCNPKFDEKTIQEPAMRIIFTVSFVGEDAIEKIKDMDLLVECVIKATKSTEIRKERTANGILWNVQNEEVFIEKTVKEEKKEKEVKPELQRPPTLPLPPSLLPQTTKNTMKSETTYAYVRGDYTEWENIISQPPKPLPVLKEAKKSERYDLMISYCHAQCDICHKMYDNFLRDKFRVWIDKENMYGSVLESMAEAIENSDIIIMCISNKYKESNACQLEAKYAWKRKKKIIPVKVEEKYDPSGWLGLLCSDDSYIDFIKLGFDKAYKELLKEINMIKNSDRK